MMRMFAWKVMILALLGALTLAFPAAGESEAARDDATLAREMVPALEWLQADLSNIETLRAGYAQARLLDQAMALARIQEFEAAYALVQQAENFRPGSPAVADVAARLAGMREQALIDAEQDIAEHLEQARFSEAEAVIFQLIALGADQSRVNRARRQLRGARLYGGLIPGKQFSDELTDDPAGSAPPMVVIPSGSFMMGSPDNEKDRLANEGPRFRVTFQRGFALSLTEVTVGQFRQFIEATGYRTRADQRGWSDVYDPASGRNNRRNGVTWEHDYMGRPAADNLPVIHVSWRDASAYAKWLSERTGQNYRLPSEAEYEYALRAGTQTRFWWGDATPAQAIENLTGDGDLSTTRRRWNTAFRNYSDGHWGPAPVASFPPNPFGLHDMGGNVMSWTEDCWHDSYVRAPTDGSAWVNPGCRQRVLRGGSWSSTPAMARSAYRLAGNENSRDPRVGFRVARDL